MKRAFWGALVGAALLLSNGTTANAQPTGAPAPETIIASGGTSGTYFRLINEFIKVCPDLGLVNKESPGGSSANLDEVLGNKAELTITQTDVLHLRAQREDPVKKRIFTLLPLHKEQIHLITRSAPRTVGATNVVGLSFGGTSVTLNSIHDLKGLKVGFWGGSATTEKVINTLALVGWMPVEQKDQTEALTSLNGGQIDAILAVGGQPLGWVEKLDRTYKLLEIPTQVAKQLDAVYEESTLTYRNLGQDGVPTVAVEALLVTRNYTSPGKVKHLLAIRQCAIDQVGELRETRGTHPQWENIDPAKASKWQMFGAPASVPATR